MKIAIVYDKWVRPDTTGTYCEEALRCLNHDVIYFQPLRALNQNNLAFTTYEQLDPHCDLYLQIDDDLTYPGPIQFHPNAYWCIDTHRLNSMVGGGTRVQKSEKFDFVFSAQKDGVKKLASLISSQVKWLPLGFDESLHYKINGCELIYDWCFVGNVNSQRQKILSILKNKWPNCFIGRAFGHDMTKLFNQSKIIVNFSISNDINMRMFEAIACGGLLITNRIDNGEEDLFGPTLVRYQNTDELLHFFSFYLNNEPLRGALSDRQCQAISQNCTYKNRMEELIRSIF